MDYSEELQHRKKKRRFRTFIAVFLFIVTLLLIGGIYLYFYSDIFYFTDIQIVGLKSLKKEDILPQDKVSFFGGVNLIFPLIKTSEMKKNYILRKLDITIEEHEPYAIWCRSQLTLPTAPVVPAEVVSTSIASSTPSAATGTSKVAVTGNSEGLSDCYWFDDDGYIFAAAPETEGALIRSVRDISGRDIRIGEYVLPYEQKDVLFKIFWFIEAAGIPIGHFQFEAQDKEEVTAFTKAGPDIYFSLRLDPSFALEPVRSLVPTLSALKYVDLRSENKVFYK